MKRGFLIAVLAALACAPKEKVTYGTEVGQHLPQYKAHWLNGSDFDLESQKGEVVLLNLWATWCGPCRIEIPSLEKMHTSYSGRGFKVIGISVDEDGAKSVAPFVTDQKINYPIALDPDGKFAAMLRTDVIPTSVLIDRDGKVVWKQSGIVNTEDPALKQALDTALNAKS